jgi:hypothetical protein
MSFPKMSDKWAAVSGVATADLLANGGFQNVTSYSLTIMDITSGIGTVTFKAKVSGGDAFEPILDEAGAPIEVDLSIVGGPRTIVVSEVSFDGVKAESDENTDTFNLQVGG